MQKFNISLRIQRVSEESDILSTLEVNSSLSIPQDISGDESYLIPAGAVDLPLPNIAQFRDVMCLLADPLNSDEIQVKFNTNASPALPIAAGGFIALDSRNISSVLVTNTATVSAKIRMTQAVKQTL